MSSIESGDRLEVEMLSNQVKVQGSRRGADASDGTENLSFGNSDSLDFDFEVEKMGRLPTVMAERSHKMVIAGPYNDPFAMESLDSSSKTELKNLNV